MESVSFYRMFAFPVCAFASIFIAVMFLLCCDSVFCTDCAGTYALDMSVTYQRAICLALLRVVAANPTLAVKSLELPVAAGEGSRSSGGSSGAMESCTATRESVSRAVYSEDDLQDIEELQAIVAVKHINYAHIVEVCKVGDGPFSSLF